MIAGVSWVWWLGFHAAVVVLLVADSLLPGRRRETRHPQAFAWMWTAVLVLAATGFAAWVAVAHGRQTALEFVAGYAIETSLSIDNLFIFMVLFQGFRISTRRQHSALIWGVAGAVVLRALFIAAGITLLKRFEWITWIFGLAEDVDAVFAKGGAMEALRQGQGEKMVRYLGVTGHFRPEPLMEAVRRHPFDTILLALNAADRHHYSFQEQLLPLAVEKQMGIVGMKVPGRSRLLASWTPPPLERQQHSWEGAVIATTPGPLTMREALYYSLSHPVSTVIIGCDSVAQLEENVQLAREFTPLSEHQMASLAARSEPVSKQALFFRFVSRDRKSVV